MQSGKKRFNFDKWLLITLVVAAVIVCIVTTARAGDVPGDPYPLGSKTYLLTVTTWSDGTVELSDPVAASTRSARQLLRRLEDQADQRRTQISTARRSRLESNRPFVDDPPANAAPQPAAATYPAGDQCRAMTASETRCRRTARGATGRCWQHQNSSIAY